MLDLIDRRAQWRPRTLCTLKDLKSSSCLDPPEDTHDQLALLVMLTSLIIQHVSSSLALQTRMCLWEMQGLKMIFTKWKIKKWKKKWWSYVKCLVRFLLIYFIMCSWSEVTFWPCNRSTTHTRMCFLFFFKSSSSSKKCKYNLKKKKKSYSDPPQRPSGCRGWCWCCAPPHQGVFPHTGKHPCQEMSRCGGRFPLLFSEQTCHTFPLWEVTNTVDVVG